MLLTSSWSNITHIDLPSWVLGANIIEEIDEDSETEDLQESCDEEFDDEEIDDEETDDEETDDKGFQDSNKEKNEESQNKFIKAQGRKMHEFEKWLIGKILKRSKREKIIKDCSIWKMSKKEIQKLHDYWRAKLDEERLLNLQTKHEGCHQELNDIYDGTPSNIIKYMESQIGENYQLDKSLFERFVDGNIAITIERTRLLTQRRMRNETSELITRTIYEDLVDGENTAKYPNICGAQHNVYFIDHNHPEDSFGDSGTQSHVNMHEVKMVVEIVKYFVKNGYTGPEDIARKKYQNNTSKPLNQRVTFRTVDNFQGEEAKIVIISLVRNCSGKYSSIGFLKSKNKSNVLLSRAKEGMYLIGNSKLMASMPFSSQMNPGGLPQTFDQYGGSY
ncbi:P-loop containing nucleoside triphosphate hydrolase protein [Rhizophagus irregularis DAOM 181602=DAOM 197198]|nr:P-loop containing nucleoside triphosphate hydrolase protein [Rhizophagus irregularis DAOM 181602=DAOM 197198]